MMYGDSANNLLSQKVKESSAYLSRKMLLLLLMVMMVCHAVRHWVAVIRWRLLTQTFVIPAATFNTFHALHQYRQTDMYTRWTAILHVTQLVELESHCVTDWLVQTVCVTHSTELFTHSLTGQRSSFLLTKWQLCRCHSQTDRQTDSVTPHY